MGLHNDGADTTLAGNYAVTISRASGEHSWSLFPIDQVTEGNDIIAEGARAMDALVSSRAATSLKPKVTLACAQSEHGHLTVSVSTQNSGIDEGLLSVLQRILVQWTVSRISPTTSDWKVSLLGQNNDVLLVDLASEAGVEVLFSNILDSSESVEWVEMVTGSGEGLGKVPRPLVHSFNLLHRGIGLFVTKDKPMGLAGDFPDLYVHRRASTKRIFPSLYDMFVGGVSLANEPPALTARREVAEELGLSRALDDSSDALSDPILVCTVCTAYNRCVVTLFTYTMESQEETVTWQEEEVDWGNFVPYPIIVSAADRSIQRFADDKKWPGSYPPIQSDRKGSKPDDVAYENEVWTEWDFVPDGLLVWEAWLKMLENGTSL
jgi:8-oxo-dGTP pyrophosphatase MutT (NUDIX family)